MKRPAGALVRAGLYAWLLAPWLWGCGDREPAVAPPLPIPAGATDLLARFEHARPRWESSRVELGHDRGVESFDAGWRLTRKIGDCEPCALGVGTRSGLELFVSRPRALTLRMRCAGHALGEDQRRFAEVSVGGTRLGKLLLQRESQAYEIDVPEAALRRGMNTVRFTYRGDLATARRKGGDPEALGSQMACSEIRWNGLPDVAAPRLTKQGELLLPAGSAVDFWLELEPGARLLLRGVRQDQATALVEIASVGGESRGIPIEPKGAGGGASTDREIEVPAGGVHRVSLHGIGDRGEVRIARLAVVGARPPADPPAAPVASWGSSRPHIIVYLVDTLRRDRLSTYGYDRPTAPNLDAFAAQAVLFERPIAVAPWTKPTVASIFTGLEPGAHGVNRLRSILPFGAKTMAELLAEAGYQTVAFAGSEVITGDAGYSQGFEQFNEFDGDRGCAGPDSPVVIQAFERWLDQRTDRRPLFLYVHTVDPHAPYAPPAEHRARLAPQATRGRLEVTDLLPASREEASALYDAEVAFADAGFGRFVATLRRHELYEDALIVFVSDHGEQFLEHGGWRHRDLFGEVINIPLVIKLPAQRHAGTKVAAEHVTQTDLLPTIAELIGRPVPALVTGQSLLPLVGVNRSSGNERSIFGHVHRGRKTAWSIVAPPFKLIWRVENTHQQRLLYEIEQDPQERRDLASRLPVQREYLELLIRRERAARLPLSDQRGAELDDDQAARLKALGYVD